MDIIDSTTASAVAAATDQGEQVDAITAAFSGNVTVKIMNNSTLLSTVVYEAWVKNSEVDPIELTLGTKVSRTHAANGTPNKVVFCDGATEIFSLTSGVGSGDISFAAAVQSGAAEDLSAIVVTALSTLPLPPAPAWTNITVGTWVAVPGTTGKAATSGPTSRPRR